RGEGVLRLEVSADVRRQERGLAQHLLPVRGLEPGVVVGERRAMHDTLRGPPLCDRWLEGVGHAVSLDGFRALTSPGMLAKVFTTSRAHPGRGVAERAIGTTA